MELKVLSLCLALVGGFFVAMLSWWLIAFVQQRSFVRKRLLSEERNQASQLTHRNLFSKVASAAEKYVLIRSMSEYLVRTSVKNPQDIDELGAYFEYRYRLKITELNSLLVLVLGIIFAFLMALSVCGAQIIALIIASSSAVLFVVLRSRLNKQGLRSFQRRIERDLQEFLTMLSLLTLAGTSFNRSMFEYLQSSPTLFAMRAKPFWNQYQTGTLSRSEALDEISKIGNLEFVHKIFRSIQYSLDLGTPLSTAINVNLDDLNERYKKQVEEEIAKIPVKILIPLGLCILPAMLILLLGPILMEVLLGINLS